MHAGTLRVLRWDLGLRAAVITDASAETTVPATLALVNERTKIPGSREALLF